MRGARCVRGRGFGPLKGSFIEAAVLALIPPRESLPRYLVRGKSGCVDARRVVELGFERCVSAAEACGFVVDSVRDERTPRRKLLRCHVSYPIRGWIEVRQERHLRHLQ